MDSAKEIWFFVAIVFQAGIVWAGIKQLRTDLNGIGGRTRRIDSRDRHEFLVLSMAAMMAEVSDEKLPRFLAKANWFIEASKERNQ